MKNKKILIVGLGKIGTAHLKSFLKFKRNFFFLVDTDLRKLSIIKKLLLKNRISNFSLNKNLPSNNDFDFVIISTDPKDRFLIFKKLSKNNAIKNLLFEKFIFNKLDDYKKTELILKKKKIKAYVNIWSKLLIKRLNLKTPITNMKITINITSNSILTNFIHFYALFSNLSTSKKIIIDLKRFKINSNKPYANGKGEIILKDNKRNKMLIYDKNLNNNDFSLQFESSKNCKNIIFSRGNLFNENGKKIASFPLSSEITSKFYFNLIRNKKNIGMPQYIEISDYSIKILKSFQNFYNKKIRFR